MTLKFAMCIFISSHNIITCMYVFKIGKEKTARLQQQEHHKA